MEEKCIIKLSKSTYLLYWRGKSNSSGVTLIVPNSAGYYSENPEKYGKASGHIDTFCSNLSEHSKVCYLVLPGQGIPNFEDVYSDHEICSHSKQRMHPAPTENVYSWENSVAATKCAIEIINDCYGEVRWVIGMCTGGAIASEALSSRFNHTHLNPNFLPLILYNTASKVRWNESRGQEQFTEKYPNVKLDHAALLNAPMPKDIIPKYKGKLLQIVSGNSDYSVGNQSYMKKVIPELPQIFFDTMSDAPIETSPEYKSMLDSIFLFFKFFK